jgi:hypothetical protein
VARVWPAVVEVIDGGVLVFRRDTDQTGYVRVVVEAEFEEKATEGVASGGDSRGAQRRERLSHAVWSV